uniref:UBA domain-containing protein n=1 Tax=Clastoptera arizonana TaxID=38151 RepID=A0A1B6CMQ4_9HEMI
MINWLRNKLVSIRNRPSRDSENQNTSKYSKELDPNQEEEITLYVIGFIDKICYQKVYGTVKISNLLTFVLNLLSTSSDISGSQSNFSLVSVRLKHILNPKRTVSEEGLRRDDKILLIEKYTKQPKIIECSGAPKKQDILSATKHLEVKNLNNKITPLLDINLEKVFEDEIHKILISLIEASARILSNMPNSNQIFKDISSRIENKMKPNKKAIEKLISLGFTEHQAKYALLIKKNNINEAKEWLIVNAAEPQENKLDVIFQPLSEDGNKDNPVLIITNLLDYLKSYRQKYFEPEQNILKNMIEMGFPAEECIDALREAGNNGLTVFEWLFGDEQIRIKYNIDMGLDVEGPIYNALFKNSTIQLGLHNPKLLFETHQLTFKKKRFTHRMNLLL